MIKYFVILITSVGLISCASTTNTTTDTAVNCYEQSWLELGKSSALSGKPIRLFNQYIEQCGEQLPEFAKTEFIKGYTEGLAQYCSYDSGYQLGSTNLPKNNICPFEYRTDFDDGYQAGYFTYREKIHNIERLKDAAELQDQQKSFEQPMVDGKQ